MNAEPQHPPLVNLEAEQALLGAIFINNECFNWTDGLQPEHFGEPLHSRIFEAMGQLITKGKAVTPVLLKTHFEADDTIKDIGGTAYLARLAASATTAVNAGAYAEIIRNLYVRRRAMDIASEALEDLQGLPLDVTGAEFTADLALRLSRVAMEGEDHRGRHSLGAAITAAIDSAAQAYQLDGRRPDAIPTGLKALDKIIGGFVKGTMVIVGARPSMGKTAIAITFAYAAAKSKTPVDFISLEMSAGDLAQRIIAIEHRVPYQRVQWGNISEQEFEKVVEHTRPMIDLPLTVIDREGMTVNAIRAEVAKSKMRRPDLSLVIVDYLSLIRVGSKSRGNRVDDIGEISRELKSIAKRYEVCMLVLHQLGRDVDKREGKRPQMSDLRESGSIEQDADVIIFPYREEYYLARSEPRPNTTEHMDWQDAMAKCAGKMQLFVEKHRMGRTGTCDVEQDLRINLITDIHQDENLEMPF